MAIQRQNTLPARLLRRRSAGLKQTPLTPPPGQVQACGFQPRNEHGYSPSDVRPLNTIRTNSLFYLPSFPHTFATLDMSRYKCCRESALVTPVIEQVQRELVLGIDDPHEQEASLLQHWHRQRLYM